MITLNQITQIILNMAKTENLSKDSQIVAADPKRTISHIVAGIDIGIPEIMVAKDIGADCVFGHHPAGGSAVLNMYNDLSYQTEKLARITSSITEIENYMNELIKKYNKRNVGFNYDRAYSIARLYDIQFISVHTTLDMITENFLEEVLINSVTPDSTLNEIVEILYKIPEIKNSLTKPYIAIGNSHDKTKNTAVVVTCSANAEIFNLYFNNGIDTIICMYLPEDFQYDRIKDNKSIIVTGHMGGDSIGMNLVLKKIAEKSVKITSISGICDNQQSVRNLL